ncbi:MAG: group II intron reverse transcriptase/maturase [Bryobacteraceae bacterium]|nr:group II intron reverse transcriptase/maturase [Bryobacteraceae bacterium]
MSATKPFVIDKWLVYEAYKAVKANAGAAGVDQQSIEDFEADLKGNLYKIWNRMSSGSYFPPPVKAVAIPKKSGGERILGIPTVADRVAQMVVKQVIEPMIEASFLPDSYGYRPGKSALDAVGVTRERCWQFDWLQEFDIKGLFDHIDHTLLQRALKKHVKCEWALLYIERWLKAPLQLADGTRVERTRGTPQGGVISPVLANLFLHYAFDVWMKRTFPQLPWCRYADDGLVHCRNEQEAQAVKQALQARFEQCGLEMHPTKTKIVYCKDGSRKGKYPNTKFDFLGYTFRPRVVKNRKRNSLFVSFTPAVSTAAIKTMRQTTRKLNYRNRTELSLADISRLHNPVLRGWLEYYGRFSPSAMYPVLRHFNTTLVSWAMRKYRRLKGHKTRASLFIEGIAKRQPHLFVHWQRGMGGAFA